MAAKCNIEKMVDQLEDLLTATIKDIRAKKGNDASVLVRAGIEVITATANNPTVTKWGELRVQGPSKVLEGMKEYARGKLDSEENTKILERLNKVDTSKISETEGLWVMRNGTPNFGNPFYTVEPKNKKPGDMEVADNGEATLIYWKWLNDGTIPKGADKQALDSRRAVILANLDKVVNADKLRYSGTAKGEQLNHVTALIDIANTRGPKKVDKPKSKVLNTTIGDIQIEFTSVEASQDRPLAVNTKEGIQLQRGITADKAIKYLTQTEAVGKLADVIKVKNQANDMFAYKYGVEFNSIIREIKDNKTVRELILLHEHRHNMQSDKRATREEFISDYKKDPVKFELDANVFALKTLGLLPNVAVKGSQKAPVKSKTPEFDKLPAYKEGQKNMVYAGIGSRETPPDILKGMRSVAEWLSTQGYTLNTGGAKGADKAFEEGVNDDKSTSWNNTDVFYANDATPTTMKIAEEIHQNWNALTRNSDYGAKLMARNTNQVFGANLDEPVDFVLAWTPLNNKGEVVTHADQRFYGGKNNKNNTGGTGQAIAMASLKGIPVINMAAPDWKSQVMEIVKGKDTTQPEVNMPKKGDKLITAGSEWIKGILSSSKVTDRIDKQGKDCSGQACSAFSLGARNALFKHKDKLDYVFETKISGVTFNSDKTMSHFVTVVKVKDDDEVYVIDGNIGKYMHITADGKLKVNDDAKPSSHLRISTLQDAEYLANNIDGRLSIHMQDPKWEYEKDELIGGKYPVDANNRIEIDFATTTDSGSEISPQPKKDKNELVTKSEPEELTVEEAQAKKDDEYTPQRSKEEYKLQGQHDANKGQVRLIDEAVEFINSDTDGSMADQIMVIQGKGGTGKSTTIGRALEIAGQESGPGKVQFFGLTFTHAAKHVLTDMTRDMSSRQVRSTKPRTINSALFDTKSSSKGPLDVVAKDNSVLYKTLDQANYKVVVVIDEASMVSHENLAEIMTVMNQFPSSKLILMGDYHQLPVVTGSTYDSSVNSWQTPVSPAMAPSVGMTAWSPNSMMHNELQRVKVGRLTEVMRQEKGSDVSNILANSAHHVEAVLSLPTDTRKITDEFKNDGSVIRYTNNEGKKMRNVFAKAFQEAPTKTKYIAFNNSTLGMFNENIRQLLFEDTEDANGNIAPIVVDRDQFILYDNLNETGNDIHTNGTQFTVSDIRPVNNNGKVDIMPIGSEVTATYKEGIELERVTIEYNNSSEDVESLVLPKGFVKEVAETMAKSSKQLPDVYIDVLSKSVDVKRRKWRSQEMIPVPHLAKISQDTRLGSKELVPFTYGYAISSYKSQGQTIDEVFYDTTIRMGGSAFDVTYKSAMSEYTAMSRTKKKLHIIGPLLTEEVPKQQFQNTKEGKAALEGVSKEIAGIIVNKAKKGCNV